MSTKPNPLGSDPFLASPNTPGPLGHNDAADPQTPEWFVGDTPGPLGIGDYADPKYARAPKFTWSNQVLLASYGPLLVPAVVAKQAKAALPAIVDGTAFIAADAHPRAVDFYTTFPLEPILPDGHFRVKKAVPLSKMTMDSLLDAILKQKSTDVLIVSHGHGGGLSVPLAAGSEEILGIKAMDVFAGNLPEDNLKLGKSALRALQGKVARVRKMGLRLVVLRACIVGNYEDVLARLKAFFGCQAVDAPKALDGYGRINVGTPTTNPKVWEKWHLDHPGAKVEFAAPNRFAWVDSSQALMEAAIADSDKAVNEWVKKHLPGAVKKVGRVFPYHALSAGTKIVFPGDLDYRKNLNRTK